MDNQQRSTENRLHWLGGIIDGEGSITVCMGRHLRKGLINYSPRIMFVNTDINIINEGVAILKEVGIPHHVALALKTKPQHKTCYRVNIGGMKRCLVAARILLPYVFAKRHKLVALIQWLEYRFTLPHKHPQTVIDSEYLTMIREKPIDPLLSVPFRDRTLGSTINVDDDTVQTIVKAIE